MKKKLYITTREGVIPKTRGLQMMRRGDSPRAVKMIDKSSNIVDLGRRKDGEGKFNDRTENASIVVKRGITLELASRRRT